MYIYLTVTEMLILDDWYNDIGDIMIDMTKCEHKNLRKAGVYLTLGRKRQKLQCKDCGKIILNGDL